MPLNRSRWQLLSAAVVLALGAAFTPDQTVTLDEGGYRLMVRGEEVGRETFAIRQSGTGPGAVIIAQGRVMGSAGPAARELASNLQAAGRAFRPTAYEVVIRRPEARTIAGRVVGNRFSARIITAEAEMMREYLVSEGALLIDEGIVHHYYFLGRRVAENSREVPILVPQQGLQRRAQITVRGPESVRINGASHPAQLVVVQPQDADAVHVWIDGNGRVLRLEVRALNLVAERLAAPQ